MVLFKDTEYTMLETERLRLVEMAPPIMTTLFTQCTDEEIVSFLRLESMEEFSIEQAAFSKGMVTYRTSYSNFVMVDKEENKFIGRCGFHMWYLLHQRAELGYAMKSDEYKGKGYMSEAIKAILDYGFGPMGLNRVEAFVGRHNPPSLRMMDKFGFTLEGVMREHFNKNGNVQDSLCFSLLKKEYKPIV